MALYGEYSASKFSQALTITNAVSEITVVVIKLNPDAKFNPASFVVHFTGTGTVGLRQQASASFVDLQTELSSNASYAYWNAGDMPLGESTYRRVDVDRSTENQLSILMVDDVTIRIACANKTGASVPTVLLTRSVA